MMIYLTKESFKENILEGKKTVLVDFFADWCGPCKMLSPIMEELDREIDFCDIAKVNIDEQEELAESFGIMSVPTMILFVNGKVAFKKVGYYSKEVIKHMILESIS